MARIGFAGPDQVILLVGTPLSGATHLGQSIYMRDIHGRTDGPPPPVDLAHEKKVGDFVRSLIERGIATAVHDLSDGGLAVGLAEMAMASGIGAEVVALAGIDPIPQFFGEDQGRYLVTVDLDPDGDEILARVGRSQGARYPRAVDRHHRRRRIETRRGACDISGRAQDCSRIVVPGVYVGRLAAGELTSPTVVAISGAVEADPWQWTRTTSRS